MSAKNLKILVTGKVQGVFFRASAKEKAVELGVKGLVMNQPDGSVYVEAEADEKILDEFVTWCRTGPPRAKVERVFVDVGNWKGFENFEIKRP